MIEEKIYFLIHFAAWAMIVLAFLIAGPCIPWAICCIRLVWRHYKTWGRQKYYIWKRRGEKSGLTREQWKKVKRLELQGCKASAKADWARIRDAWNGKADERE